MFDATGADGFVPPDLTSFCRLDGLGLVVTGQRLEPDRAELACKVAAEDRWCRRCGAAGEFRDSVCRRLAHEPFGWRPTVLKVTVPATRAAAAGTCGARTRPLLPPRGPSCPVVRSPGRCAPWWSAI